MILLKQKVNQEFKVTVTFKILLLLPIIIVLLKVNYFVILNFHI